MGVKPCLYPAAENALKKNPNISLKRVKIKHVCTVSHTVDLGENQFSLEQDQRNRMILHRMSLLHWLHFFIGKKYAVTFLIGGNHV
jgi:hypothetical protein